MSLSGRIGPFSPLQVAINDYTLAWELWSYLYHQQLSWLGSLHSAKAEYPTWVSVTYRTCNCSGHSLYPFLQLTSVIKWSQSSHWPLLCSFMLSIPICNVWPFDKWPKHTDHLQKSYVLEGTDIISRNILNKASLVTQSTSLKCFRSLFNSDLFWC